MFIPEWLLGFCGGIGLTLTLLFLWSLLVVAKRADRAAGYEEGMERSEQE